MSENKYARCQQIEKTGDETTTFIDEKVVQN